MTDMLSYAAQIFRRITLIAGQRHTAGIPLSSLLIQIELQAKAAEDEIAAFKKLMTEGAHDNAQQGDD
jgi:hypothetical protein